jgi:hypothetical protein
VIHLMTFYLFRRHIAKHPNRTPRFGTIIHTFQLRKAEVHYFDAAFFGQHDVIGFDIQMNYVFFMRLSECFGELDGVIDSGFGFRVFLSLTSDP